MKQCHHLAGKNISTVRQIEQEKKRPRWGSIKWLQTLNHPGGHISTTLVSVFGINFCPQVYPLILSRSFCWKIPLILIIIEQHKLKNVFGCKPRRGKLKATPSNIKAGERSTAYFMNGKCSYSETLCIYQKKIVQKYSLSEIIVGFKKMPLS